VLTVFVEEPDQLEVALAFAGQHGGGHPLVVVIVRRRQPCELTRHTAHNGVRDKYLSELKGASCLMMGRYRSRRGT